MSLSLSNPPSRPPGCRAFDGRCWCVGRVLIVVLEGGPRPPRRGSPTWGSPSSPARPAIPREWPWRGRLCGGRHTHLTSSLLMPQKAFLAPYFNIGADYGLTPQALFS